MEADCRNWNRDADAVVMFESVPSRRVAAASVLAFLLSLSVAAAGAPRVEHVRLVRHLWGWEAYVTIVHRDEGWSHFVDRYEVRSVDDRPLFRRWIERPSVRPSRTYRQRGFTVPPMCRVLKFVAHDKLHGWGPPLDVRLAFTRSGGFEVEDRRRSERADFKYGRLEADELVPYMRIFGRQVESLGDLYHYYLYDGFPRKRVPAAPSCGGEDPTAVGP